MSKIHTSSTMAKLCAKHCSFLTRLEVLVCIWWRGSLTAQMLNFHQSEYRCVYDMQWLRCNVNHQKMSNFYARCALFPTLWWCLRTISYGVRLSNQQQNSVPMLRDKSQRDWATWCRPFVSLQIHSENTLMSLLLPQPLPASRKSKKFSRVPLPY